MVYNIDDNQFYQIDNNIDNENSEYCTWLCVINQDFSLKYLVR